MSLALMIGELAWLMEKYNLSEEKSNYKPDLQKNLMGKDENCKLLVTCGTCMNVYAVFLTVSACGERDL